MATMKKTIKKKGTTKSGYGTMKGGGFTTGGIRSTGATVGARGPSSGTRGPIGSGPGTRGPIGSGPGGRSPRPKQPGSGPRPIPKGHGFVTSGTKSPTPRKRAPRRKKTA